MTIKYGKAEPEPTQSYSSQLSSFVNQIPSIAKNIFGAPEPKTKPKEENYLDELLREEEAEKEKKKKQQEAKKKKKQQVNSHSSFLGN